MSNWDSLYRVAESQTGYFTAQQALEAEFSFRTLSYHAKTGKIERIRRNIYRLTQFPPGDHEELVVNWLWSQRRGVFSHETALLLHDLSDVLAAQVHLKVPLYWQSRRLRTPAGLVLHYGDVPEDQQCWFGAIPATDVFQTLLDCTQDEGFSSEWLHQAFHQANTRGLLTPSQRKTIHQQIHSHAVSENI